MELKTFQKTIKGERFFGLKDQDGNVILEPKFEKILSFEFPFAIVIRKVEGSVQGEVWFLKLGDPKGTNLSTHILKDGSSVGDVNFIGNFLKVRRAEEERYIYFKDKPVSIFKLPQKTEPYKTFSTNEGANFLFLRKFNSESIEFEFEFLSQSGKVLMSGLHSAPRFKGNVMLILNDEQWSLYRIKGEELILIRKVEDGRLRFLDSSFLIKPRSSPYWLGFDYNGNEFLEDKNITTYGENELFLFAVSKKENVGYLFKNENERIALLDSKPINNADKINGKLGLYFRAKNFALELCCKETGDPLFFVDSNKGKFYVPWCSENEDVNKVGNLSPSGYSMWVSSFFNPNGTPSCLLKFVSVEQNLLFQERCGEGVLSDIRVSDFLEETSFVTNRFEIIHESKSFLTAQLTATKVLVISKESGRANLYDFTVHHPSQCVVFWEDQFLIYPLTGGFLDLKNGTLRGSEELAWRCLNNSRISRKLKLIKVGTKIFPF